MINSLSFTDLAVPHRTEDGIEFIELDLVEMQIVQKIGGKSLKLLSRLHQPVQHSVGIDFKGTRRASNPQSLSQTGNDMDDELGRRAFAMEDRAVRLVEKSLARYTLKLTPGLAAGMAIGADIPTSKPAAIGAIGIGTEMTRRIDGTPSAPGEDDRWRW